MRKVFAASCRNLLYDLIDEASVDVLKQATKDIFMNGNV